MVDKKKIILVTGIQTLCIFVVVLVVGYFMDKSLMRNISTALIGAIVYSIFVYESKMRHATGKIDNFLSSKLAFVSAILVFLLTFILVYLVFVSGFTLFKFLVTLAFGGGIGAFLLWLSFSLKKSK